MTAGSSDAPESAFVGNWNAPKGLRNNTRGTVHIAKSSDQKGQSPNDFLCHPKPAAALPDAGAASGSKAR